MTLMVRVGQCKDQSTLPREALAMIRYHSFYPWHREGAYTEYMDEDDHIDLAGEFSPLLCL